jgi:RsmE family RNA methyltransferase
MNVVLLAADDLVSPTRAVLDDERSGHIREVLRASLGDRVVVGSIGGKMGYGTIVESSPGRVVLDVVLEQAPPAASGITLAVALPRPPTLRKVLTQVTAMGVKKIALFHSARVEKSYWQSSGLAPEALRRQLLLGLEQARDTILPEVEMHPRFRPFAEDRLVELAAGSRILLADLEGQVPCPANLGEPATLVIGPEGGLIPFEVDLLREAGAVPVRLGPRPLRVETAVVAFLGRLIGC